MDSLITTVAAAQSTVVPIDDLPWLWADFGQSNTIVLAGIPRGQHKALIEVVDPEGNVFTGQTVTFYSGQAESTMTLDKLAAALPAPFSTKVGTLRTSAARAEQRLQELGVRCSSRRGTARRSHPMRWNDGNGHS